MLEPLLRRFEHSKAVQEAPAFPGPSKVPGLTDMPLGDYTYMNSLFSIHSLYIVCTSLYIKIYYIVIHG